MIDADDFGKDATTTGSLVVNVSCGSTACPLCSISTSKSIRHRRQVSRRSGADASLQPLPTDPLQYALYIKKRGYYFMLAL